MTSPDNSPPAAPAPSETEPASAPTPSATAPDAGPDAAVRAADLHKTYSSPRGDVPAVQGIDLSVTRGEFFGLLGPNGAGKSTTIGMLTTLVVPTSGRAWVCGLDVAADSVEVKRRIGMVSQNNTLDNDLTAVENLEFRGRYFGMTARDARQRAEELLEMFNLTDRRKGKPFELSGGQAKRLMICRALVHRPEVLFLDEPTAGLDPQTRVNLWEVLRGLQAQGQTIVLTTHYMEEAEALCDRVAVIDHGKVLASGTVEGLKTSAGADTVITVTFDGPAPEHELDRIRNQAEVGRVEVNGEKREQVRVFAREPDGILGELVTIGSAAGVGVNDASVLRPSLESAFLALTGREYRE